MTRIMLLPLFAFLLTACEMAHDHVTESHQRVIPGESLSELLLPGLDRDDLLISQLQGKVVVLNVWATWCPPCRRELPSLQRLGEQLDSERFAVLGLSVDDDKHHPREYLIDRKIQLTSYIDLDMSIAGKLGAQVFPDTYLIGTDGRLLMNIVGEREWDSPQVIAALEAAYRGDYALLQGIKHQDVRD
ncbi:MAG: TlpA family protein disulfide reductase [Gammaproteobacteria bacterium]|nr:TlpA family protein disulfide reductase [Gammaproteobacteria bacterium]